MRQQPRSIQVSVIILVLVACFVAQLPSAQATRTLHQLDPDSEDAPWPSSRAIFGDVSPGAVASNVELVGQIGGAVYAVAVVGNYAYIGVGPRLVILNIVDPVHPHVVGQTAVLPDLVRGVAVAGSYAYIVDQGGGLQVIDAANPAAPVAVGTYDTPGVAAGVAVVGSYAYVADTSGLRVINVANPAGPVAVGFYATPGWAMAVTVAGSYAYVADDTSGLRVINVANPAAPIEVGFHDTPGRAVGVTIAGSYAYVADDTSGLRVINVTNPAASFEVGFYDTPGNAHGVGVMGNYAYIADGNSHELRVINVANPAAPISVNVYTTPGFVSDVVVAGSYAYVADGGSGLRVLNVFDVAALVEVGAYDGPGSASDVAVVGSYAYVAGYERGLSVINVANPAAPIEVGAYDTPGSAGDVVVVGSYAYMADGDSGLLMLNVANPAVPIEVGAYDTPGSACGVVVAGSYAYVADWNGLRMINVANPAAPVAVGTYGTFEFMCGVAVAGSYAYVADGGNGLRVINMVNPAAPVEVGFHDTPGDAHKVAVAGGYAYVADWNGGLRVINVANPATPAEVGAYGTQGVAEDVAVVGSYVYVADYSGLRVINVANPAAPAEVGAYNTPRTAQGVAVEGNYAYIAAGSSGLIILRFTGESSPTPTKTPTFTPTATASPTATSTATATGTHTPTQTLTPTKTPSPTVTPSHTPTATDTPTDTITPTPSPSRPPDADGDTYENDDACARARFIPTDGTIQNHTFHKANDQDWVAFNATAGATYLIQGDPPGGSPADLVISPYAACGSAALPGQDYTFSPSVRLQFQAQATGPIYLKLVNHDPTVFGPHVAYDLSVRAVSTAADRGALILVAGRRKDNDLQANIHQVAAHAYRVFLNHGYTSDDIYYLATDLTQPGADALATKDDLAAAITSWANARVGPERPLTLYLVDHGEYDRFMLDDLRGEYLAPDELDGWLAEVEQQHPGLKVNVIIEACLSGSFIDLPKKVSGPGRVVIASTANRSNAYASEAGASFSDQFLDALDRNSSLYAAFQTAHWGARVASAENQIPWLDDNGNGTPNEPSDGLEAQRRGFTFTGTLANDKWPPYIVEAVGPATIQDSTGVIRARVLDNPQDGVRRVWAVIYPPSYVPPPPTSGLVRETLDSVNFTDRGAGWFEVTYRSFDERGAYRVVIYAEDGEGLAARPVAITVQTGQRVFLPVILR